MNKELKNLIYKFHKKLEEAQDSRLEVMNYLEEKYGIDVMHDGENVEDKLSWCYGINIDAIEELICKLALDVEI